MIDPIDNSSKYGSKGESWAPEFITYMKAIVTHPIYEGMPDAIKDDGKIQWEAPSNRSGGKYQYTHQKRKAWWKKKATSVGIDSKSDQWISKTAKLIHPTGEKPCKRCGSIMRIAYAYPQQSLIKRLKKKLGEEFDVSPLEPISDIIQKAYDLKGERILDVLSELLSTRDIQVPKFGRDLDGMQEWIEEYYIPQESALLSPGAMSNAPDRLDGFHSFNRCCRGSADKGRHATNLLSYTTDRRVFEFWSEGDWIAADRLMGLVRSQFSKEKCADGGDGPPTADHIGPLSLGFCHRPEFKLLSRTANSAKNNRMSLADVKHLIGAEKRGECVVSWYAKPLWDLRKEQVVTEELALRLSKQLRDNQRSAIQILCKIYEAKKFSFLVYLLELGYAEHKIDFGNLRIENFVTVFDGLIVSDRKTKYSSEQKARRIRIGFEALRSYKEKGNRHYFSRSKEIIDKYIGEVSHYFDNNNQAYKDYDLYIESILLPKEGIVSEEQLRELADNFPTQKNEVFENAKMILVNAMEEVGKLIHDLSDDNRYIRDQFDLQ